MTLFHLIAMLVTLSALFAWINYKFLRMPTTIGVMVLGMVTSLLFIVLGESGFGIRQQAVVVLNSIEFDAVVLHGLLAFLLFAGALHIDLGDLGSQKGTIALLSTVGVVVSTFVIGGLVYWVITALGFGVPFIYCLLFGALISPTDPIAVLGILKSARVPKSLEIKIAGESLFNDGIGVVVFLALLAIATTGEGVTVGGVMKLFLMEAIGGIVLGLICGYIVFLMLRRVDHYQTEVLLTLAVATGTYALAEAVHMSAPLAVVAAGLLIGNHGRTLAMSKKTVENIDTFWELIDEILNAALFLLIGLELIIVPFTGKLLLAGALAIPIVLLARFLSVAGTVRLMTFRRSFTPGAIRIMTWSGLRGGISVALVLSLPRHTPAATRDVLLTMTYCVVIFSILVQGLTVKRLVQKTLAEQGREPIDAQAGG